VPPDDALPPNIEVTRDEVFFGAGKGTPFGLLYRPQRADDRLVVWMHGGPTATLADRILPREVYDLAPLGISVLAVEQSGMLGGGLELTRRLPRLGHRALVEDMRSVADWVRRSGYRRAFLIVDSFGGASGVIAAVDHPDVYEHIFLRAPMLALRPPEKSVRGRAIEILGETAPSPGSQREFEETVLGGRERFAAALESWTARLRPSPRLSFYFGDFDPVSAADDLPAVFAGHPSVMIVRASHETTAGSGVVERDIVAKLGKSN
jgi:pimeloyl-ACP methyl ester carboxylesterase